jgi:heme a synthase
VTLAPQHESRWPHRLAVVLVCATFPLIWVGGLVTSYDAGMAVPDWPSTYGYNLFLYPWTTWIAGPWDLFIEHGHRLLGALVGMLTIALVVVTWRCDDRRWLRWLAVGALLLVIAQGMLGGARVLIDARQLAKIHGCVGPAFFALATALAVFTSRVWRQGPSLTPSAGAGKLHRLAALTAALAYVQLILGANLRHIAVTASVTEFRAAVLFHIAGALVVAIHVVLLVACVLRGFRREAALRRPALVLAGLIVAQIALGLGSWVVKYSLPASLEGVTLLTCFTIEAKGMLQAFTVTAHTAGGSLILAMAVMLALRAFRLAPRGKESWAPFDSQPQPRAVEAAA